MDGLTEADASVDGADTDGTDADATDTDAADTDTDATENPDADGNADTSADTDADTDADAQDTKTDEVAPNRAIQFGIIGAVLVVGVTVVRTILRRRSNG